MAITVNDTTPTPTHHASLSDGTTTVGFIFADSQGNINPEAIKRYALQRTAIKTTEGANKYSDLELPYLSIPQDDWSGGRGQEIFEDDTTRYFDANRMDTSKSQYLHVNGVETFAYNYRAMDASQPEDYSPSSWIDLYGTTRYAAHEFTASASYSADFVELWIAKVGTPGTLTVELRDTDKDGSVLKTVTLAASSVSDVTAEFWRFDWTTTQALTSGNGYAFVVYGAGTDSATNYWQISTGTKASVGFTSSDGSTWGSADAYAFYFRCTIADTSGTWWDFFEYKRVMYAISKPVTGNSFLYINGDRGAADDNTADLTYLQDGGKSWTADEWIGCVALIIKGPGSEEEQPWRLITDNDATSLTVSPDWNVVHTTSTEYVILGSDKWTSELDLGGYVTDVAVADEFVYFARGDSGSLYVLRYQAYNNAGTWTTRNTADNNKAEHLCVIRDTAVEGNFYLWGTQNQQGIIDKMVWYGKVPRFWGGLYTEIATLTTAKQPLSEQAIANVTPNLTGYSTKFSLTDTFATGIAASEAITATNITQGDYIAFESMSSIALDANDVALQYSDQADLAGAASVNLPAYTANVWQWTTCALSMNAGAVEAYIEDAVISIGFNVLVDKNSNFNFNILGGIKLIRNSATGVKLPSSSKITGIIPYAGNATDPVINPWVFTETGIYEIQAQNDYQVVELPLGEIKELRSELNARARTVNDVYLWFNLSKRLQRYYSRNLDDVGPDRDAGLPSDRTGQPRDLVSYPGRVFVSIDSYTTAIRGIPGTSSVLMYSEGWHEVFRAHRADQRIFSLGFQSIPSDTGISRLWISLAGDIIRVPISIDPLNETNYKYAIEGHIISSWMYAGMQDVTKFWKSLTVFSDGTASVGDIYLDYKVDQDSSWTVVGKYATYYDLEKDFTSSYNVTGKRLRIRLRFRSLVSSTPVLKAWLVKGMGIVPIKYGYAWQSKLTEGNLNIDLWDELGNAHGSLTTVDTVLAKLDAWASAATVLTLRCVYSAADNKNVILNAPGLAPVTYVPEEFAGPLEEYVVQVDCVDI